MKMEECNLSYNTHRFTITMCYHFVNIAAAKLSQRFSPRLFQTHFIKEPEGIISPESCVGPHRTSEKPSNQTNKKNHTQQTNLLYMKIT